MGLIFLGIFVLAMVITGIGEYRRFLRASKSGTRTAFAKKDKK
jgi:Na+-transporting methylmalonyl-CoA/oxaloacetate decarboxylase gamma subunit